MGAGNDAFFAPCIHCNWPSRCGCPKAPSDCISPGTQEHMQTLTPDQAKPGNRTFLPGLGPLLAFAERLKMNVGCGRAHLQSLALSPVSALHFTGHQIPQAFSDVYFCIL